MKRKEQQQGTETRKPIPNKKDHVEAEVKKKMRKRKRAKRGWQAMRLGDNPNVNLKPPNGL